MNESDTYSEDALASSEQSSERSFHPPPPSKQKAKTASRRKSEKATKAINKRFIKEGMDKDLDAACQYLFNRLKEKDSDEITPDSLHRILVQNDIKSPESGVLSMLHYARVQKTALSLEEAKEGILIGSVDFDLFREMAETLKLKFDGEGRLI